MEEWKDIKGYEGYYQISNYGNGRSVDRVVERLSRWGKIVKVHYKGIELVKNKVGAGYLRFDLCKNGIYDYRYIHQLVWETFVGEIPEGMEIDHIDTDKTNNNLSNLRLVDRSGNMHNPITYKKITRAIALKNKNTGEIIKLFKSVTDARKEGYGHADAVARGVRKQDKGYIFEYI